MGRFCHRWLLFLACLGVFLGWQMSALALPLAQNQASPAGNGQTEGQAGNNPLPWAVVSTLASHLSAATTNADGHALVSWHPNCFIPAVPPQRASLRAASPRSPVVAGRGGSGLSSWLADQRSRLPLQVHLSPGSEGPVPTTPPSSPGGA